MMERGVFLFERLWVGGGWGGEKRKTDGRGV